MLPPFATLGIAELCTAFPRIAEGDGGLSRVRLGPRHIWDICGHCWRQARTFPMCHHALRQVHRILPGCRRVRFCPRLDADSRIHSQKMMRSDQTRNVRSNLCWSLRVVQRAALDTFELRPRRVSRLADMSFPSHWPPHSGGPRACPG